MTSNRMIRAAASALATLLCAQSLCLLAGEVDALEISPTELVLEGKFARAQLLVRAVPHNSSEDRIDDLTRDVEFLSSDPGVVVVDKTGKVTAVAEGTATIKVLAGASEPSIAVKVRMPSDHEVDFLRDVRPVLAKAGCAAGACHAAQHGQGGFKLSVFGFDPDADYIAITRSSRGRRINHPSPGDSLLLRKPSMQETHGGGLKLHHESMDYEVVRHWIDAGAKPTTAGGLEVETLEVVPGQRVGNVDFTQQLRVVAHYNDGTRRDVTSLARFDATDTGIATVSDSGYVTTVGRGQTGVMVRYEGQAAISTFVVPYRASADLGQWQSQNYVDQLAEEKFRDLGLVPSPPCDDATFIRRAFLDCIGTLPSPEVVREFLQSQEPNKREQLIDRLLGLTGDPSLDLYNDQYAAYWTLKWSDLVRNNSNSLGEQGMWALHNWIKESFRTNKPYDQFVRELVTAKGSIYSNGPANFFRVNTNSSALTEATSQLFLGVRLECAKCHHHPFEKYGQHDYYAMAAFFSRVGSKNSEEFGLFGRETVVTVRPTGEVSHPRTRKRLQPTPLGGEAIDHPLDRRIPLADWLTNDENEFFATSVVNRYVRYLLGSGLVEPVDDMRSTNPPSNAPLMEALAEDFVAHDFDLKHLIRTIMTSRLYGLSSQPSPENRSDRRFYSHFQVKRLSAEPLLDAVDHATGVRTKFNKLPLGTRAIELPDAEYPDYFLTTFAKPRRVSVCECERSPDANLAQALHTLNGDTLNKKMADKTGRIAKWIEAKLPHDQLVTELYLSTLCRPPTDAEQQHSRDVLEQSDSPQEAYQDLMWALMNSKQFLFVH